MNTKYVTPSHVAQVRYSPARRRTVPLKGHVTGYVTLPFPEMWFASFYANTGRGRSHMSTSVLYVEPSLRWIDHAPRSPLTLRCWPAVCYGSALDPVKTGELDPIVAFWNTADDVATWRHYTRQVGTPVTYARGLCVETGLRPEDVEGLELLPECVR